MSNKRQEKITVLARAKGFLLFGGTVISKNSRGKEGNKLQGMYVAEGISDWKYTKDLFY